MVTRARAAKNRSVATLDSPTDERRIGCGEVLFLACVILFNLAFVVFAAMSNDAHQTSVSRWDYLMAQAQVQMCMKNYTNDGCQQASSLIQRVLDEKSEMQKKREAKDKANYESWCKRDWICHMRLRVEALEAKMEGCLCVW